MGQVRERVLGLCSGAKLIKDKFIAYIFMYRNFREQRLVRSLCSYALMLTFLLLACGKMSRLSEPLYVSCTTSKDSSSAAQVNHTCSRERLILTQGQTEASTSSFRPQRRKSRLQKIDTRRASALSEANCAVCRDLL